MNNGDAGGRPAWLSSFELAMRTLEDRVVYLCQPEQLERRPEYRKQPGALWLTLFVHSVESATSLQAVGARRGELTSDEARRLEDLLHTVRQCIRRNVSWVREQLRRELEELVRPYATTNWIE